MKKMKEFLKKEYVNGYSWFDYAFLFLLIVMQILTYMKNPESPISIVTGILGTIATVLCAKGKITHYLYGTIQIILLIIIDYKNGLYLDIGEQFFYIATTVYGIICWKKNLDKKSQEIVSKELTLTQWSFIVIGILVLTVGVKYFGMLIGSNQAGIDAFTNVIAVFAQILCVLCYKDQWPLWIILDISNVIMYARADDKVLAMMYIGWTIICVYGWYNWNKSIKKYTKTTKNKI